MRPCCIPSSYLGQKGPIKPPPVFKWSMGSWSLPHFCPVKMTQGVLCASMWRFASTLKMFCSTWQTCSKSVCLQRENKDTLTPFWTLSMLTTRSLSIDSIASIAFSQLKTCMWKTCVSSLTGILKTSSLWITQSCLSPSNSPTEFPFLHLRVSLGTKSFFSW